MKRDASAPRVVIVGRPNVGKSSILNCLARERISIVDPRSGTTRDRVSALVEHEGRLFELVDTGGIGLPEDDELSAEVEAQIAVAMRQADAILFVTDVREGLIPLDETIARRVRGLDRPVVLVANKADTGALEAKAAEFFNLGFGEPWPLSAREGVGRRDLFDHLAEMLPPVPREAAPGNAYTIALVGKRNVGKSSLVNALAREERVIVSEIPGTTRDAVDVSFTAGGKTYTVIDTAGIRKKRAQMKESVDFYSYTRTERAIRRADVVFLVMDAVEPASRVDKKVGDLLADLAKPVAIAVNKFDLAGDVSPKSYAKYFTKMLPGLISAPVTFVSALERKNLDSFFLLTAELVSQASHRVGTGELNRAVEEAIERRTPPVVKGKAARVYFATQTGVRPPTFVFFVNDPGLVTEAYRRYLAGFLKKRFPFHEVPVKIYFRPRNRAPSEKHW